MCHSVIKGSEAQSGAGNQNRMDAAVMDRPLRGGSARKQCRVRGWARSDAGWGWEVTGTGGEVVCSGFAKGRGPQRGWIHHMRSWLCQIGALHAVHRLGQAVLEADALAGPGTQARVVETVGAVRIDAVGPAGAQEGSKISTQVKCGGTSTHTRAARAGAATHVSGAGHVNPPVASGVHATGAWGPARLGTGVGAARQELRGGRVGTTQLAVKWGLSARAQAVAAAGDRGGSTGEQRPLGTQGADSAPHALPDTRSGHRGWQGGAAPTAPAA